MRSTDKLAVAPFEQMWTQARQMRSDRLRQLRNYRMAGAVVLILMLGGFIVRNAIVVPRLEPSIEDFISSSAVSEDWQGPLDFLLDTPGSEFLTSTPTFDSRDLLSIQTDFGQEVLAR